MWPAIGSSLVGAMSLIALLMRRTRDEIPFSLALYIINTAAVISAFSITNPYFANGVEHWVPFQGGKLGCLISALIAPSFPLGFAAIVAQTSASTLQFLSFSPEVRQRIVGEPWAIIAFGLAAILTLFFRLSRMRLEKRNIEGQAEVAAIKRNAKMSLGLRDLMNTPLQTLEFSTAILRDDGASDPAVIERMTHALETLKGINELLTQYGHDLDWKYETVSFDPKNLLRQQAP